MRVHVVRSSVVAVCFAVALLAVLATLPAFAAPVPGSGGATPLLQDSDGDGIDDFLDPDNDGDGNADNVDPGPLDPDVSADPTPDTTDINHDNDNDGIPGYQDPDDDGDGIADQEDPAPFDPTPVVETPVATEPIVDVEASEPVTPNVVDAPLVSVLPVTGSGPAPTGTGGVPVGSMVLLTVFLILLTSLLPGIAGCRLRRPGGAA
jgi:hypothetical protein